MLGFRPLADAPTGGSAADPTIIYADGDLIAAGHTFAGTTSSTDTIYADGDLSAAGHTFAGTTSLTNTIYADGDLSAAGHVLGAAGSISEVVYADGDLSAAGSALFGSDLFRREIVSPRPPLNLFERTYRSTDVRVLGGWTYIMQPPTYLVPDELSAGVFSEREVRYILTALSFHGDPADVSIKIVNFDDRTSRTLVENLFVLSGSRYTFPAARFVMKSQDALFVKATPGAELTVSAHYVANQREVF